MTRKRLKLIAAVSALSMTMTSVLPVMAAPTAADDSSRNTSGNETADISPVMELEFEGNTDDTARTDRQVSVKKWVENESVAAEEDTDYSYVDGVIGDHALQLNGSAYVSLGEEADLNPENLTFSMWINP